MLSSKSDNVPFITTFFAHPGQPPVDPKVIPVVPVNLENRASLFRASPNF